MQAGSQAFFRAETARPLYLCKDMCEMGPMSTSFVMPNYNHSAFLDQSIAAMLAQSRPADQIIILDDASTDNSLAIIQEFAKRDRRIVVVACDKNVGVVANLNAGLRMATGDFIAFPGADDCLANTFLAETARALEADETAAFATACVEIWDRDQTVTGTRPFIRPSQQTSYVSPDAYRRLLACSDNHFLGHVTLYRRAALLALGGFDPSLGSLCDGLLARRLAVRHGFWFIPHVLGAWRKQGGNYSVVQSTDPASIHAMLERAEAVIEAEPPGLFPPDYAALLSRRVRFGGARLLCDKQSFNQPEMAERLHQLGLDKSADTAVIELARTLGSIARFPLILWVFLRFRPFSLPVAVAQFSRLDPRPFRRTAL